MVNGNFIEFSDDGIIINIDFITNIEPFTFCETDEVETTIYRVYTNSPDYIDLTKEQFNILRDRLMNVANTYITC